MKVFLSWSGDYSREVAQAFADWLPCVIQSTEIFLSSESIGAGELWHSKISSALSDIDFGLVFVSNENQRAPWLLFEAGALSKRVGQSRVVPILCEDGIDGLEFKKNPLSHFQYVQIQRDGIYRAVRSIFESCSDKSLTDAVFEKSFSRWIDVIIEEIGNIEVPIETVVATTEDGRLAQIEAGMSSLISMVRSINMTVGLGSEKITDFPQRVDFTLPRSEFFARSYTTGELVRRAVTADHIEMAIEYILNTKTPSIQRGVIPELQARLDSLRDQDGKAQN